MTIQDLARFTGTEKYYRATLLRNFYHTDGVEFLAKEAKCYWLIDLIASHQLNPAVRREPFQVWILKKTKTGAVAYMKPDSNLPRVVEQEIPYTDFPFDQLGEKFEELWLIDGSVDGKNPAQVLILKSEY
jgi:hypothetical protein